MTAQISPLPTPPSTNDPANFNTRGDAFLGQLPTFQAEANALSTEVNALAVQVTNDKATTTASAAAAAASSNSALNAPGTNGTSTTSQTIGTGTKTFTTQAGKAWLPGQGFFIASTASPLNQMTGVLTAYNSGTGAATVEVSAILGSGTFASWNVGLSTGAPMAVASQAQAEAGVDALTVMTPQRTKQAIDKFASLQGDATVSAATTLTSASKYQQTGNMAIRGAAFTLPDATTYAALGPKFAFINIGNFDLPVKDSAGKTKAFVRPGQTATTFLVDNATAAGTWAFEDAAIYGETASLTASLGLAAASHFKVVQLDADRDLLVIGSSAATATKAIVYNRTTGVWGAPVTVNTVSMTGFDVVNMSSSAVLVIWSVNASSNLAAMVLSVSGTTITANSVVNGTAPSTTTTILSVTAISSSYAILSQDSAGGNLVVHGLTVSGTTPTWSAASTVFPTTTSTFYAVDYAATLVGTTLVVMSVINAANGFQARALTISGTTITQGATYTALASSNTSSFKVELLVSGRLFVIFNSSGSASGRLLSLSGVTISSSAPAGLISQATSQENLGLYQISSTKLLVATYGGGQINLNLFVDTVGVLTAGTTVSYSIGGTNFGFSKTSVAGSIVYLYRHGSIGLTMLKLDCSGASPAILDTVFVPWSTSTTGAQTNFAADAGPTGNPADNTAGSNIVRLSGASGSFVLPEFSAGNDMVVLAPGLRRVLVDHLPCKAPSAYGRSPNEVFSLDLSGSSTLIRKLETTG